MLNTSVISGREHAFVTRLSANQLRNWLRGRWALLFSHPDDFATHGFEADRWLAYVRDAFESTDVRAIGVGADYREDRAGWIRDIGGCTIGTHALDHLLRGRANADRENDSFGQIPSATSRFVTILDGELRPRRTLIYGSPDQAPSPIGLAEIAASLRARSTGHQASLTPQTGRMPSLSNRLAAASR